MALNLWECDHRYQDGKRCKSMAVGVGGAVGLAAVGWLFIPGKITPRPENASLVDTCESIIRDLNTPELQSRLYCPVHRPDAHGACRDRYRLEGDDPGPDPCSTCTATEHAERWQAIIAPEKT